MPSQFFAILAVISSMLPEIGARGHLRRRQRRGALTHEHHARSASTNASAEESQGGGH
jgi:hypothetical protein